MGPDATGVGWVYLYALVDRTGQHDISQLRSIQDWFLKYELQTVAGVSEVASVGGMVKQYQVKVNPDKLRAFNMPLSHIQMAIQRGNQEMGASVVEMAEAEYMVRASGYIRSIEDLQTIPLGLDKQGTPLLLKDVADIELGPQMRRGIAELNGEGEVAGGIVVMRFGENAQKTIDGVKAKLETLKAGLPEGVEVVTVYDRSGLIGRAIDNLWQKLLEEFLVVALVCVVFLFHVRSSLVAIISLPMGILTRSIYCYALSRFERQYYVVRRYCDCYRSNDRWCHCDDRKYAQAYGENARHRSEPLAGGRGIGFRSRACAYFSVC